jgi:SAM-dependent methyltransferase
VTEPSRYPLRNAEPDEAARLDSLQNLRDASTIRHFDRLGVAAGWRCAELGAGGGSIARWLAGRVGATGSVTAIDADTSLFADLATMAHVRVIQDDLTTMEFGSECFDLVHSRAVLMHVNNPAGVVERVVGALAPGGMVFFEEVDGAPAQEASRDPALPHAFRAVLLPMAAQWTWARGLAAQLRSLGLVDVVDDMLVDELTGATPSAAFWAQTLDTVRPIVTDPTRMAQSSRVVVDVGAYDEMIALLSDPSFSVPFTARHRVFARRARKD